MFRRLISWINSATEFILKLIKEKEEMATSLEAFFNALNTNLSLTSETATASVSLIDTVQSAFTRLGELISEGSADQSKIDEATGLIESSNNSLLNVRDNLNKIAETAQATAPGTVTDPSTDPVIPVPIEDTVPTVDPSTGEVPVEITPTPSDVGLDGSVQIDPVEPSVSESSDSSDTVTE